MLKKFLDKWINRCGRQDYCESVIIDMIVVLIYRVKINIDDNRFSKQIFNHCKKTSFFLGVT